MNKNTPQIKLIVKKTRASLLAQTCPVCNSFGTVGYAKKVCHGCQGKGYILIPTAKEKR